MSGAFVKLLLVIARVLAQFSDANPSGTLKLDGSAYTPSAGGPGDVLAAKWWGTLTGLAGILDAQATPLSAEQKNYLDRLLFGGMGSLNDLSLDPNRLGPQAAPANQELNRLRKELFDAFQLM
ncbi:MAG: hypothetical protein ACYCZD_11155 [Rhodanobacter sp.]